MKYLLSNLVKKKLIINHTFIPPVLEFTIPEELKNAKIEWNGDFPRKVEQYEKILSLEGFDIHAPLGGIIFLKENFKFSLKVSGKNQIYTTKNYNLNSKKINFNFNSEMWIDFLNKYGLYSFEYNQTLAKLFSKKIQKVIFLTRDPYIPDYWSNFFLNHFEQLKILKKIIEEIYKTIKVLYYPDINKKFRFNYNFKFKNNYQYHYKYLIYKNSVENEVLVFSPATLYSILRAVFYNEPFVRNFMVFSNYFDNSIYLGLYFNGTLFKDMNLKVSYVNNFFSVIPMNLDNLYFDIYSDYYYYYKVKKEKNLCTSCFICNNYCPVDANPMALFENKKYFKVKKCIQCGICEDVCESNLSIMDEIKNAFYN